MSDTQQYRPAHETWPVLARLPEVAVGIAATPPSQSPSGLPTGYRFDPPQRAGVGNATSPPGSGLNEVAAYGIERPSERASHRQAKSDDSHRAAAARASSVLPRSNPFSAPEPGLSLATFVRFLTLVALFAAAATWAQSTINRPQTEQPHGGPRQSLEQHGRIAPESADISSVIEPKSAGPLRATSPRVVVAEPTSNPLAPVDAYFREITPAQQMASPSSLADDSGLPRVQTSDPGSHNRETELPRPPAIARLPGIIQPNPDSNHVENKSSLH